MVTVTIDEFDVAAIGLEEARAVAFLNAKPEQPGQGKFVEVPLRRESFELVAGETYRVSFRRAPAVAQSWVCVIPHVSQIGLADLLGLEVDRPRPTRRTQSSSPPTSRNGGWIAYTTKDA